MGRISEYEVEELFIKRLEGIGYEFINLKNYDDVIHNLRLQLEKFKQINCWKRKILPNFQTRNLTA